MTILIKRIGVSLMALIVLLSNLIFSTPVFTYAESGVNHLIINQVYGGGGKGDTPFSHSFIELYNPTNEDVDLGKYSLQYASTRATGSAGTTEGQWVVKPLTGILKPNDSYVIRGGAEVTVEPALKYVLTDDVIDLDWKEQVIDNNQFRVALVKGNEILTEESVAGQEKVIDLVGVKEIGEGNSAPSVSKQKAIRRVNFQDTNDNGVDFQLVEYKDLDISQGINYLPKKLKDKYTNGDDVIKPVITVSTIPALTGKMNEVYTVPTATAVDNVDGEVVVTTVVTDENNNEIALEDNTFVPTKTGRYTLTYTAKDTVGNTAITTYTIIISDEPTIEDVLDITKIAGYNTGTPNKDGGVAEIVKYNEDNKKFYLVNGSTQTIDIVSLADVKGQQVNQTLTLEKAVDIAKEVNTDTFTYGDVTSIVVNTVKKVVVASVQHKDYDKAGKVVVMDYDGKIIDVMDSGIQPDMITMTKDGKYILVANEAEPRNGLAGVDPEGSVTIVNYETKEVKHVKFDDTSKIASDVHIRNTQGGAVVDLEPEYIALSGDEKTAYVALQENNAIATINVENGTVKSVKSLGFKDYSVEGNELDAANDGVVELERLPIKGLYMPDGITTVNIGGEDYILTANEGDATEWGSKEDKMINVTSFDKFRDNIVIKDVFKGMKHEEAQAAFDTMKNSSKYNKLEVFTDMGTDAIYVLGGRSFAIWKADSLELVYDSGNDFEKITAQRYPNYFNVSNNKIEMDARSTKKGPEPEDVKVGKVGDKVYAFVGLERVGGVMTYDITNPTKATFANYINTRDFSTGIAGDVAPEGLDFISSEISPTKRPLVLVGNEVSGTVSVLELQTKPANTVINIIHTNDSHGRLVADSKVIGIDTVANVKKAMNNAILVDAGDTLHGLPFVTMNKGKDVLELMNLAGYDFMTAGNHDFNYGYESLVELNKQANFPIMGANVLKGEDKILDTHSIKEIDGVKVGFFGLTSPETAYKTNPNNVKGITFEDPIKSAKQQVAALQAQGADVIIALAHIGMDDATEVTSEDIAKAVPGINVIIDGHSHHKFENGYQAANNTLIASAGEYLGNVGHVTVTIDTETKKLVNKEAGLITKAQSVEYGVDETLTAKIAEIKAAQDEVLSKVIGATTVDLDGARENVRTQETNLGNLITDAMLAETGADIAITNGGGIRASIKAGDITKGDVVSVLPFGNFVVTKKLTGAQIKEVLEHGVHKAPESLGAFSHVAGLSFVYDQDQKAGSRVLKITIDSQEIDMNKEYLVATNDFLAAGGDEYPAFGDVRTENEFNALDEVLANYISKQGTISPAVEGRIVVGKMGEGEGDNPVIMPTLPEGEVGAGEGEGDNSVIMPTLPEGEVGAGEGEGDNPVIMPTTPDSDTTEDSSETPEQDSSENPKTGDATPIALYGGLILFGSGAAYVLYRRRKAA